jgi:hypothetical protein
MANQRYIHDTIWTDAYFQTLEPDAKLLFIYLLTNEHLEVSGIYQITARTIANETGLERETVNILMADLINANKIIYSEDEHVVGLVNYHKHNGLINNPKYRRAIEKSILKLDESIRSLFCERLGIDWVSIGNPVFPPKLNQTKLNQTKLNQTKLSQDTPPTPPEKTETATFTKADEAEDELWEKKGYGNIAEAVGVKDKMWVRVSWIDRIQATYPNTYKDAVIKALRKQAEEGRKMANPEGYIEAILTNKNGGKYNGK